MPKCADLIRLLETITEAEDVDESTFYDALIETSSPEDRPE